MICLLYLFVNLEHEELVEWIVVEVGFFEISILSYLLLLI